MWSVWITLLIGVWFFISGLIPNLSATWNLIIFGIAAIVFGFIAYFSNQKYWSGLINGIIGIWMLLCGIWFGLNGAWNFIIFGIIMVILALINAASRPEKAASTKP